MVLPRLPFQIIVQGASSRPQHDIAHYLGSVSYQSFCSGWCVHIEHGGATAVATKIIRVQEGNITLRVQVP